LSISRVIESRFRLIQGHNTGRIKDREGYSDLDLRQEKHNLTVYVRLKGLPG